MKLRKLLFRGAIALLLLIAVMGVRTLMQPSLQVEVEAVAKVHLDETALAARLASALRFPTISSSKMSGPELQPFADLLDWFEINYPTVYSQLRAERVAQHSLVLTWLGADASAAPGLFMAHLDVVPVEPGTEADWIHPAFGGVVADGFIWGRGALDVKSGAVALHEAIRELVAAGFQPQRSLYFAFGHDEEIGGAAGNGAIVPWMQERGIELQFVIDEGGFILDGLIPELEPAPVALIDIAEKAYCTIHLRAKSVGGHSSMPPVSTAVGKIAAAIHKLESNPFPLRLTAPIEAQFRHLAPEMPLLQRFALSNLWLTAPLIKSQLAADARARSLIQTSTAATIIAGGVKENVVPQQATATVNFRLLPGDTPEAVLKHVTDLIDDSDVVAELGLTTEPAAPSSADSATYKAIARSTREIHPDCIVLPTLLVGATDSRHYRSIAKEVYRFSGLRLHLDDVAGFHGTNERMRIDYFADGVRIMMRMIQNLSSESNFPKN